MAQREFHKSILLFGHRSTQICGLLQRPLPGLSSLLELICLGMCPWSDLQPPFILCRFLSLGYGHGVPALEVMNSRV